MKYQPAIAGLALGAVLLLVGCAPDGSIPEGSGVIDPRPGGGIDIPASSGGSFTTEIPQDPSFPGQVGKSGGPWGFSFGFEMSGTYGLSEVVAQMPTETAPGMIDLSGASMSMSVSFSMTNSNSGSPRVLDIFVTRSDGSDEVLGNDIECEDQTNSWGYSTNCRMSLLDPEYGDGRYYLVVTSEELSPEDAMAIPPPAPLRQWIPFDVLQGVEAKDMSSGALIEYQSGGTISINGVSLFEPVTSDTSITWIAALTSPTFQVVRRAG